MKWMRLAPCLLAAACVAPNGGEGRTLSADIFEDLPAPKTARYRHGSAESFSYRSPTFRCGKFVYDHPGAHADAVRFFRDTLTRPPYNWEMTGEDRTESGSATLVFEKGDDRCVIDIDQPAGSPDVRIVARVNYRR